MKAITDPNSSSYNLGNPNINSVDNTDIGIGDSNSRILPRQLSTGSLRGTQTVGYGDVKIDGSNDQITIGSVTNAQGEQSVTVLGNLSTTAIDQSFGLKVIDPNNGQLYIGILPDGNLGMEILDTNGNEVFRAGFLPLAGVYGFAGATPGNSLEGQV